MLAKPFDPEEAILLATLAGSEAESKVDQRRRSSAIGRKLRMLRAHGLIRKVPRTYRYQAEEGSKRIAELAKRVEAGRAEDTPHQIDTPGRHALYNNLGHN